MSNSSFKTVIHRGTILLWILQGCIGELNGADFRKIKEGLDIGADGFTVRGKETEQFSGTNGPVIMDNIFDVRLPGSGETVSVIVDLEAQNDSTPYPIGRGRNTISEGWYPLRRGWISATAITAI